jgi:MFS family permease
LSATPRVAALAPFGVRNFRFQWPADLATSWAFEMETIILGWYVLVETGSVFLLTLFGALQFLGTVIAPFLGIAGDRIGHRNVLAGMRAVYAGCALTLLMLALSGLLTPVLVLIVAGVSGMARASDMGVRGALIADIVPPSLLMGASGISRTTQDSARIAGALAGAGLFAFFGFVPAYVAVTGFYIVGGLLLLGIRIKRFESPLVEVSAEPPKRGSPLRDLREGAVHIWTTPRLNAAMWLAFLVNLTGFPLSHGLLPFVAKDVYHIDQTGLGYLVASFAAGALIGSLALTRPAGVGIRLSRLMIVGALVWYTALLVFAQTNSMVAGMACLLAAGCGQSLCVVALQVVLLRAAELRFRGLVMGVRMLAIYGLPVGLLTAGALIGRFGFQPTGTGYALFGIVFTLAIAVTWRAAVWRAAEEA